ncbi:MAG: hypothetical protein MJ051_04895 [Akkermansia sp.]|nr:hypothetical protein [Akkermansia sp.]
MAITSVSEASDTSRMMQRVQKLNAPREAARKREEAARLAKEKERLAKEAAARKAAEQKRLEEARLAQQRAAAQNAVQRWELFDPKHMLQPRLF